MVEVEHDHVWLHYWLCEDEDGYHKFFDDPHYPIPEHFGDGYECACGAVPDKGAAP